MGIFRKKEQPFDSVGVAQVLLSDFVEISDEKSDHLLGPNLAIPPEMKSRFHSKAHLYRLAIVLAVLINNEQKHPGVLEVRKSLEKLVFTMPQEDGMAFLEELREAAGSLHNLLYPENKNKDGVWMSWAQGWLQEVGINETNPVSLFRFAMCWADFYLAAARTMKDLAEEFGL